MAIEAPTGYGRKDERTDEWTDGRTYVVFIVQVHAFSTGHEDQTATSESELFTGDTSE